MEKRELRRSNTDKMLAGVCGGIGEYFNISGALVRLLFVILAFAVGSGLLIYIIAMIIMPKSDVY